MWGRFTSGAFTTELIYDSIADELSSKRVHWWSRIIWQWQLPSRINCFIWLFLENSILTWDNLCRRGLEGPNRCGLCNSKAESIVHIFANCNTTQNIWTLVCDVLMIKYNWVGITLHHWLMNWLQKNRCYRLLPAYVIWGI